MPPPLVSGKIASPLGVEKGGYISLEYSQIKNNLTYYHYTEDGVNFFDGNEGYSMDLQTMNAIYQGNVVMKNEKQNKIVGEMDFRIVFTNPMLGADMKLIRDKSYGKSTFNGKTVTVDEMED